MVTAEQELYNALDLDQNGTVSYAELRKGFRGKRKDELRQLAEACGHQWQSLEGRLYDLPNTEGFSFQEFEACLSAAVEEDNPNDGPKRTLEDRLQALIDMKEKVLSLWLLLLIAHTGLPDRSRVLRIQGEAARPVD